MSSTVELHRSWALPACRLAQSDLDRLVALFKHRAELEIQNEFTKVSASTEPEAAKEYARKALLDSLRPTFEAGTRVGEYSARDWRDLISQLAPADVQSLTASYSGRTARLRLYLDIEGPSSVASATGSPEIVRSFIGDVRELIELRTSWQLRFASSFWWATAVWVGSVSLTVALSGVLVQRLHGSSSIGLVAALVGYLLVTIVVITTAGTWGFVRHTEILGWGRESAAMRARRRALLGIGSLAIALAIGVGANLLTAAVQGR